MNTLHTWRDVRRFVYRFSYKPGSSIDVDPSITDYGEDAVAITYTIRVNEFGTNGFIKVSCAQTLTLPVDERLVEDMICSGFRYLELHEMDEWLKKDGECVKDPHPELTGAAKR